MTALTRALRVNTLVAYLDGRERPPSNSTSKGKGKATEEIRGHTDEVLALALSDDGKYLASGGKDRKLVVWDAEKGEWIRSFFGHKDTISVRN